MYKGKYVLLPMNELKEKISNYLNTDFKLLTADEMEDDVQELVTLVIEIDKSDIKDKDVKELTAKIVGANEHMIEDSTFDFEYVNKLVFNMEECSFMLKNIFEMKDDVIFDDKAILVNEDKDVYLTYIIKTEKTINLHGYNCDCGAVFKIESKIGDNGVYFCPYCGEKRDNMGYDAFDGEFWYNIEEC